jgi:hypothetical protein
MGGFKWWVIYLQGGRNAKIKTGEHIVYFIDWIFCFVFFLDFNGITKTSQWNKPVVVEKKIEEHSESDIKNIGKCLFWMIF